MRGDEAAIPAGRMENSRQAIGEVGSFSLFNQWARTPHARALSGDFNRDGATDIALVGGDGWSSVPIAFSRGDGTFSITNGSIQDFAGWANLPGVQVVAADVNGDSRHDLIASGGPGWFTIPVAFSNGDGTFTVTNLFNSSFPALSRTPGARLLAGDIGGGFSAELILVGGEGWTTIPVAFSNRDGTFNVTSFPAGSFAAWAQVVGAQAAVADVNGDLLGDLVLAGGQGWTTVPMALSFPLVPGFFVAFNEPNASIPVWSQVSGAKLLVGNVDGDHWDDIILTGGAGWSTIPVGFSNGDGMLSETNAVVPGFPGWAAGLPPFDTGAQVVSGDFNGDAFTDVAAVGGANWFTLPVAFSNGNGTFRVTNAPID